jgi:DNA-directed RNA polymerase specialized sigma24 family protein
MGHSEVPTSSLDELWARAASGDPEAEASLFSSLRVRFLDIAKRRVRKDDLEDVVQEALGIIHTKHQAREPRRGMLLWSFAVLRNVIGNYYQKRARRDRGEAFDERFHVDAGPDREPQVPTPSGTSDCIDELMAALTRLAQRDPRCAIFFRRILESLDEGGTSGEISRRALRKVGREIGGISRNALYVALHRCRAKLRAIVREMQLAEAFPQS